MSRSRIVERIIYYILIGRVCFQISACISVLQTVCPSVMNLIRSPVFYKPIHTEDIKWNYEKFLIGPDGKAIYRYAPMVDPSDTQLNADIETELRKLAAQSAGPVG